MTIGIPQALFYWKRPYFWETFFENLGFKVLLSPETNKEIIEKGVEIADAETCFSIKVLYGHILSLEKKADLIFIPRLKKNELGLEYCPKFFALPDLFSLFLKKPIISAWIDLKRENLKDILVKLARQLNKDQEVAESAIAKSLSREREEREKTEKEYFRKINSKKKKIVLISHPYNLYDEYINLGIKEKIENLGATAIFIDEVPFRVNPRLPRREPKVLLRGSYPRQSAYTINFHWEFGQEIMAQIKEILKNQIQGAIEISSFQCGCDAVLKEFVEREFKERKIPFLYLLIDEQTGEAGLQTRLEAFFDTI